MFQKCLLLGVALCLVFAAAPSVAVELGVRGYYWMPGLDGDINYESEDTLDLDDDLEMDSESYPMVDIFAGFGDHHLIFTYYKADYSGSEKINQEIKFGGSKFDAGTNVKSKLEYRVMDFAYQWDAIDLENVLAGTSLGLVGKVKYLDISSAKVEGGGESEEVDIAGPVPMVGLNMHVGILADIIEARFQVTGIGYSGNSMVEFFGDISYTPFPFVGIHAGYRSFAIDVDVDDLEANFTTAGPYGALTISF
ncbi:MAG: hypothetical protein JRI64_06325 [Deltaproteobacteria bacterium]|nr:hypothetical protein [Deltaproteobacteria bacterium]